MVEQETINPLERRITIQGNENPLHTYLPNWQVLQRKCLPETNKVGGVEARDGGELSADSLSPIAITIQQPSANHLRRNPSWAARPQVTRDLCDPYLSSALIKTFPTICGLPLLDLEVVNNNKLRVCLVPGMHNCIPWYPGKHPIRGLSRSLMVYMGWSGCYQRFNVWLFSLHATHWAIGGSIGTRYPGLGHFQDLGETESLEVSFTNRSNHKL